MNMNSYYERTTPNILETGFLQHKFMTKTVKVLSTNMYVDC